MLRYYLIFWKYSEYDEGEIEGHLSYLKTYDGSPQNWDGGTDLLDLISGARGCNKSFVVTDDDYNIIYEEDLH